MVLDTVRCKRELNSVVKNESKDASSDGKVAAAAAAAAEKQEAASPSSAALPFLYTMSLTPEPHVLAHRVLGERPWWRQSRPAGNSSFLLSWPCVLLIASCGDRPPGRLGGGLFLVVEWDHKASSRRSPAVYLVRTDSWSREGEGGSSDCAVEAGPGASWPTVSRPPPPWTCGQGETERTAPLTKRSASRGPARVALSPSRVPTRRLHPLPLPHAGVGGEQASITETR